MNTKLAVLSLDSDNPGNAICFSPDSRLIALSDISSAVVVWEVATEQHVCTLIWCSTHEELNPGIRSPWDQTECSNGQVCFSPDSNLVASINDSSSVVVWDIRTRQLVYSITCSQWYGTALNFLDDGTLIASGGCGQGVSVFEINHFKRKTKSLHSYIN